jgi:hypothetical protein
VSFLLANITSDASDTTIIGGTMTTMDFANSDRNFVDLGNGTRIF